MKLSYISVGVMVIVAYILTVVGSFSSFDASFVVVPLICLAAVPASICIKLVLEKESVVIGAPIVISVTLILALYLTFTLIDQIQMYVVVTQLVLWAFIGFLGMKGSSRRSAEPTPTGGR